LRARDAHNRLKHLGPVVEVPLYNQPSDTPNGPEAIRKHVGFKPKLARYLRRRAQERTARAKTLTETYSIKMVEWLKNVEKVGIFFFFGSTNPLWAPPLGYDSESRFFVNAVNCIES